MNRFIKYFKKHRIKSTVLLVACIAYYFCLPQALFKAPLSTVIEDKEGHLIGAKIASDGQWRFPQSDHIPEKFEKCIVYFEDEYFYKHPGFNPVSIFKALKTNISTGKTRRGGSTISQQLIRLARKNKRRTYSEKLIELIQATRLELRYSKQEILNLYASYAPFGGNVVGLEVAAWRYFGVSAAQLSWAESATLAVLPNAPSLIYPGKNQGQLKIKRDRLLKKLFEKEVIDTLTYQLAITESLPQKPYPLPQIAPHFLAQVAKDHPQQRTTTSLDARLQDNINTIVNKHYQNLKQNEIHNAAVLVLDVKTRNVIAYVGNTPTTKTHQKDVDIIKAARSTGSVLKPLLYASMLDAGSLLPEQLIADIPTQIAGYSPQNYEEQYDGAVTAKRALARSLNVPAVRLLQTYGLQRFRDQLEAYNIEDIDKTASHYGLTLILGGAEANLWDLCKTYAAMAATLNHFSETSGEYFTNDFTSPVFLKDAKVDFGKKTTKKTVLGAGSIYLTFEAMKEVNRPEGNEAWEFFDSSKEIAWKTGTSFGNRDAWSIGVTPDYVVGVWAGNADGEGRPDLTGLHSAAPILFDVFDVLSSSTWFSTPYDALTEVSVCSQSGYLATSICPVKKQWAPIQASHGQACKFHQLVHLDKKKQFRVNAACEDISNIVPASWFVLPPLMAHYYKTKNARYTALPPFRKDCYQEISPIMDFIYPKHDGTVYLPKDFDGKRNDLILKIAHAKTSTTIFWYLDETYLGQTQNFHEMAIQAEKGSYIITAIDSLGNEIKRRINIQ